jgi:hypothetical protein
MKFLAGMIGAVFGGLLLAGLVAAADKGRVECYTEAELEQALRFAVESNLEMLEAAE